MVWNETAGGKFAADIRMKLQSPKNPFELRRSLVFRKPFNVLDDEDLDGALGRLELEVELAKLARALNLVTDLGLENRTLGHLPGPIRILSLNANTCSVWRKFGPVWPKS